MAYEVLGILTTQRCNFRCAHCCNDSGPTRDGRLDDEDVCRAFDEATEVPTLTEVGLSGGEPFLDRRRLRHLVSEASRRGFGVSVTTNGSWARTPDLARTILGEVIEAGLTKLVISLSSFHLRFAKPERIQYAIDAAHALGLPVDVNVVTTRSFGTEQARAAVPGLDDVELIEIPLIPAGRAAENVVPDEFQADHPAPAGNCHAMFTKLAVDAEGDVFPCCSPGGFTTPLRVGNLTTDSVPELVQRAETSPLHRVLDAVGPLFFLDYLRTIGAGDDLPDVFTDQCHLCHAVLSDPVLADHVLSAAADVAAAMDSTHQRDGRGALHG